MGYWGGLGGAASAGRIRWARSAWRVAESWGAAALAGPSAADVSGGELAVCPEVVTSGESPLRKLGAP